MSTEHVLLLHGGGQTPSSWKPVIEVMPAGFVCHAADLGIGPNFSMEDATRRVEALLDELAPRTVHLCGLSLGAMLAVHLAAQHPHRVGRLLLSGVQVRPPRRLMAAQNAVVGKLPARLVETGDGISREELLIALTEAARVDLRRQMPRIQSPTLVVCGSRDPANLPGARQSARLIPGARLEVIAGVGHTWNVSHPQRFARLLDDLIRV